MSCDWGLYLVTPPALLHTPSSVSLDSENLTLSDSSNSNETVTKLGFVIPLDHKILSDQADAEELPTHVLLIEKIGSFMTKSNITELIESESYLRNFVVNSDDSLLLEFYDLHHSMYYRSFLSLVKYQTQNLKVKYGPPRKMGEDGKPPNNGTIILFHISSSITNAQLSSVFSEFGEIRQIRTTPKKTTQRFIEFWDIRAAEKAVSKNGTIIFGYKVLITYSVPGGQRRKALQKSSI